MSASLFRQLIRYWIRSNMIGIALLAIMIVTATNANAACKGMRELDDSQVRIMKVPDNRGAIKSISIDFLQNVTEGTVTELVIFHDTKIDIHTDGRFDYDVWLGNHSNEWLLTNLYLVVEHRDGGTETMKFYTTRTRGGDKDDRDSKSGQISKPLGDFISGRPLDDNIELYISCSVQDNDDRYYSLHRIITRIGRQARTNLEHGGRRAGRGIINTIRLYTESRCERIRRKKGVESYRRCKTQEGQSTDVIRIGLEEFYAAAEVECFKGGRDERWGTREIRVISKVSKREAQRIVLDQIEEHDVCQVSFGDQTLRDGEWRWLSLALQSSGILHIRFLCPL